MSKRLLKKAAKRLAAINPPPGDTSLSSRPNTDDEDGWSDDSASTVDSNTSIGSRDDFDIGLLGWEDDLKRNIEDLSEKRASTREAALAKIVKILAHRYTMEVLEGQRETLIDMLKRSIKKASSVKEGTLATKAIALIFITLGEDEAYTLELYTDIIPLLKYTINTADPVDLKLACLESLALLTFITGSEAETQDILKYLSDILNASGKNIGVPPSTGENHALVIASALNAYGLLFASNWGEERGTAHACWDEFQRVMPVHIRYLSSASTDIRVAAGENVALFFESLDRHNAPDEETSDGSDDDHFQIPEYDRLGELINILSNLATDSNRHRSKKSRATQKSAFRDIVRTVESGEHPSEKLKFRRGMVTFHTWCKILSLNAFRAALAEGLHVHFEENPLMHDIFHYFPLPAINIHSLGGISMSRTGSNRSNRSNVSGYSTPRDEGHDVGGISKTDQKYLNAEVAKMRTRDLKKARGGRSKAMEWDD